MQWTQAVDQNVLSWIQSQRTPEIDALMAASTHLGDRFVLAGITAAAALLFFLLHHRRSALVMVLVGLTAFGCSWSLKHLVGRERPTVAHPVVERPTSASFPSSHALGSAAIYLTLTLGVVAHVSNRALRIVVMAVSLGLVFLIGVSRLYLGVHYPLDVIVGWILGLLCALVGFWLERIWTAEKSSANDPLENAGRGRPS